MSMIVASVIFVPLLAIAIALFIWSLGGSWPIRDKALLPRAVIGRPAVDHVPRLPAFLGAVASLVAGVVALALADPTAGGGPLTLAGALLAAAFLARGIAGYTQQWRAAFPVEPFATLDRRNYSPLSIVIGAGFALLVIMRLL